MRMSDGDNKTTRGTGCEPLVTLLIVVVMVALPLRMFVAVRAAMVSRDSAGFIWYAQGLEHNAVAEMRTQKQHPLYPAMILAAHHAMAEMRRAVSAPPADPVKSWIAAGVAVTLLGGLAVVAAMYAVGATLFDSRVAIIAALLAAVTAEFCQLSGDALTDMPHLAVYLFGFAAAVRGVRDRSMGWLAAAGALSGVAYLLRPEGAEVAVVAAVGILTARRPMSLRKRLGGVATVLLAAGIVASPYMVVTGKIVPKKSMKQLLWGEAEQTADGLRKKEVVEEPPLVPPWQGGKGITSWDSPRVPSACGGLHPWLQSLAPSGPDGGWESRSALASGSGQSLARVVNACARIGENWARSLRVMLLLPAIWWWGTAQRRRPCEPTGAKLAVGAIWLHVVILVFLIVHFDYLKLFSLRHVMILAGLTLPFSAAGIAAVLDRVSTERRRMVMAILAVGLIGPTLPWMLETRSVEAVHIRRAGEWVREHGRGVPRIMTTRHLAALYANGVHVWCPWDQDAPWVLAEARDRRPNWMVFEDVPTPQQAETFFEALKQATRPGEHIERAGETTGDGPKAHRAIIFRYTPPS